MAKGFYANTKKGCGGNMYLLVFTTLMIGIIGLYTQVLGLQAARLAGHQSAVGSTMLQWHTAAVSMAVSIIKTNAAGYALVANNGCSLTFTLPPNVAIPRCPKPTFFGPPNAQIAGTVTGPVPPNPPRLSLLANYKTLKNECVNLASRCTLVNAFGCNVTNCSSTYDLVNYQFHSILYKDPVTNQNFVVTFVPAPIPTLQNPAPGNVSLVNVTGTNTPIGLTISDLARQLNNAGAPKYTYGSLQGFSAGTPRVVTASGTYNLPSAPATGVPNLCNGSATCVADSGLALIGSPDGF